MPHNQGVYGPILFTTHTVRKTVSNIWHIEGGLSMEEVALMLVHADSKTTRTYYVKTDARQLMEAANRLRKMLYIIVALRNNFYYLYVVNTATMFDSFQGIKFYIYSHDHNPPHFHAKYGEYEIVIEIMTLRIMEGDMPSNKLKAILKRAKVSQAAMFQEFNELNPNLRK